jgi:hypothetical protein
MSSFEAAAQFNRLPLAMNFEMLFVPTDTQSCPSDLYDEELHWVTASDICEKVPLAEL